MPTENQGSQVEPAKSEEPVNRRDRLMALLSHTEDKPIPRSERGEIALAMDLAISTLLFAGGAEPRQEDRITPVRVSGLRGGLRQMWRAAFGWQYKDVESLRQAEGLLWGGVGLKGAQKGKAEEKAARASLVRMKASFEVKEGSKVVYEGSRGKPVGPATDARFAQGTELGYALFSAREESGEMGQAAGTALEGVKFRLSLSFPEDHPGVEDIQWQVLQTLRLYILFGGLGGRTRRGLGAFALEGLSVEGALNYPEAKALEGFWHPPKGARDKELKAFFAGLGLKSQGKPPPPYPQLGGAEVAWKSRGDDPHKVWKGVLGSLKSFRQYRVNKDTGEKSNYGVSVWPEPKIIREMDKGRAAPPFYPRGEFGLPIVFHFSQRGLPKDDYTLVMEGERGAIEDRMTSPIIIKPVHIGGRSYIGVALRLNVALPDKNLVLQVRKTTQKGSRSPLGAPPPDAYKKIPPMKNHTSALDAFMDHFRSGDRHVTLGGGAQ